MAITVNVNGNLTLDQSDLVQTGATTDTGNDTEVTYAGDILDPLVAAGLDTAFLTYLNALGLSDAQKEYAALVDAASSLDNFITVSVTAGEEIDNLFFSDSSGALLNGDAILIDHDANAGTAKVPLETLAGEDLFLWTDPLNTDFCLVTTSSVSIAAGRIVAVIYLDENDTDHLSAQVQMITFEALKHFNATNPDDSVNFTDALQVSASGSLSFDFSELKSGSNLWVAVGNSNAAMLVSGGDLHVDGEGKKTNDSDVIHTSQGGVDATIGVNNQLFDNNGETAFFTLVTGMDALVGSDDGVASDYVVDHKGPKADGIDYTGYINTNGAAIFISQSQGNDAKDFDIKLWETGGDPSGTQDAETGTDYIPGLIGDTAVNVATVTVYDDDGDPVATWVAGTDPDAGGPLLGSGATVTGHTSTNGTADIQIVISGQTIEVNGVLGEYTIEWTSAAGETFNRFELIARAGQFDVGRVDIDNVVGDSEGVGDNLLVDDDGPVIGDSHGGTAIVDSNVSLAVGSTGNVALGDVEGTDGESNLEITSFTPTFSPLAGLTIEGHYTDSTTKTTVQYFQDKNNNDVLDGTDVLWYTMAITQNGNGDDFYNFTVNNAPSAPPLEFNFNGLPSGQNLFGMVGQAGAPNGPGIIFYSSAGDINDPGNGEMSKTSGTINTSQGGGPTTIGSNNQMIDPGEGIFFNIINDPDDRYLANVPDGLDQNEADDADFMDYGSLKEVTSSFMRVSQTQGNDDEACTIEAFNITNNSTEKRALFDAPAKTHVNITYAAVYNGSFDPLNPTQNLVEKTVAGADGTLSGDVTISISGGVVSVSGLEANYIVVWETNGTDKFDQVLVSGTAGKFDIGGFGLNEPQTFTDHELQFTATITDGDSDTASASWSVFVDA